MPTNVRASHSNLDFIFLSKGEDELKDGQTFTSIIHGLSLLSRNTSNPNSSKQGFL